GLAAVAARPVARATVGEGRRTAVGAARAALRVLAACRAGHAVPERRVVAVALRVADEAAGALPARLAAVGEADAVGGGAAVGEAVAEAGVAAPAGGLTRAGRGAARLAVRAVGEGRAGAARAAEAARLARAALAARAARPVARAPV